jgi:hypothetical protein
MMYPINLTHTIYTGQAANSGPSPKLWSQIRSVGISPDGFARGYYAGSEFMGFGGLLTTTAGDYADEGGSYSSYQDSGCTILPVAATGGQIELLTTGSDNLECWLQYGGATNTLGKLSATAGADKLTIFEARIKLPTHVGSGSMFVGLTEAGLAANNGIADDNELADKDLVGFSVTAAGADNLLFVHRKASGAATPTTLIDYGAASVAYDTFYNLGFIYNPQETAAKKLKVYVNNAASTTYGTSTTLAGANFPLGELLTFTAGVKTSTTTARNMIMDWWHYWQEA